MSSSRTLLSVETIASLTTEELEQLEHLIHTELLERDVQYVKDMDLTNDNNIEL